MANRNFFIHNGLTVGSFAVDAATGNLVSTGTVTLTTTTNASSTTTGALVVAGGVGIGGNAVIGGNLTVSGTLNATVSGSITTATNLAGGAAGSVPYQSSAGTTTFRSIGTAGTILQSDGAAPQWISTTSLFSGITTAPATPTARGTVFGYTENVCCNTYLGISAGNVFTTGYGNIAVGWQAGSSLTDGSVNIAIGLMAMFGNTSGSYNVGVGFKALCANTTGVNNIGVGFRALYGNTSGVNNVALGSSAMFNNTTGCQNIALGTLAFAANRTGNNNIAIGCGALRNANSPLNNIALGMWAGCAITTGSSNVIIGSNTGSSIATSLCNIIISDGVGTARITINAAGAHAYDTAGTSFGSAGQILCSAGNAAPPGWINQSSIAAGSATNLSGGSAGALSYQSAAGTTAFVTGTAGQLLQSAGTGAPTFVGTATLAVGRANNLIGGSAGAVVYQSAGNATAFATGTAGQLLVSGGTGAPTFVGTASLAMGFTNNIIGGSTGQLVYQSGGNATGFIGPGTAGQLLVSAGATAPTYTNTGSITVGFAGYAVSAGAAASSTVASCATNVANGLAGQIVYQSAANTTAFTNAGTTGTFLQANGGGAPTWVSTASMNVFNSTCAVSAQTAGSAGAATNISAGLGGSIPFQRSAGTTDFIGIGSAGTFLVSNGTTATWISTATLGGGGGVSTPATPNTLGLIFGYTTGAGNVAIGCCAGNITQTGTGNFATGCASLKANVIGSNNFAAGCNALNQNSVGCDNIGIGYLALNFNTTGSGNLALGRNALGCNTTGVGNIALGPNALVQNQFGDYNIAQGDSALNANISGSWNVAIGTGALLSNISGICNVAIGYGAGFLTSGASNIVIGSRAETCGATGSIAMGQFASASGNCSFSAGWLAKARGTNSISIGRFAGGTAGNNTVALGAHSLCINTGDNNIAIGCVALTANTTGSDNFAVGQYALYCNRTGSNNIAIGSCSLYGNTRGNDNTALGKGALYGNTTGVNNIAIGCTALGDNQSGSNNIALGASALVQNGNGNNNIALGPFSLAINGTGSSNIAIGACSGCALTTGSNNTVIGSLAGTAGMSDTVLIGAGATERIRVNANCMVVNNGLGDICARCYFVGGTISGTNSGNLTITMPANTGTPRCINITGQLGFTTAGPGGTINIAGGVGQSTTGGLGGNVCINGGNATVGNANGGNIVLTSGSGSGTGDQGLVRITNTNFAQSTETAALTVAGGIGVGGAVLAGGQICAARDGFYNWASNGTWASGAGVFTRSISSVVSSSGWTIDMTATNVLRIGSASVTATPTMRFSICSNGDVCVPGTLFATASNANCAAFVCTSNNQQINSLGVGTAASGTAGEIRATNNITAYYSSDCRLKTNITPIANAMCKVSQISGVLYDWTDDYIKQQGGEDGVFVRKRDVGLIAQEIETILPEIVVDRQDGYKAIKYERVVALLVEAIKELKADFDKLSNKVNKE